MSVVRLRVYGLLALWLGLGALSACGSNGRRASLVSVGGQSSSAGHSGEGNGAADGGQAGEIAGGSGNSEAGAAGDRGVPDAPYAIFPERFVVDVGCGKTPRPTALMIRNGGAQPLTVSKLSADSDYLVEVQLPLVIAPGGSSNVLVTAPAPKADAKLGESTMGTLTFTTNESGALTHQIELTTTLFGGMLEFLDKDGSPLANSSLTLAYSSPTECPDATTFRVHNTGNLAFVLTGPTFPPHFGGTSTDAKGVSLPPDGYEEFKIGGFAKSGDACSGSGALTFTVGAGFCGTAPALNVLWPVGSLSSCECAAPSQ